MCSVRDDLLSRYLQFSVESCEINKAISAVKPSIVEAYCDDPSSRKRLFLINDLNLFLMQVMAFDGFVTACLHTRGLDKGGSLQKRLQRLANDQLRNDSCYQRLLNGVAEIEKIRDAWIHGQGDPSILKNPNWPAHLTDRFALEGIDGRLWIRLSQKRDGRTVWSFIINTLHDIAALIWESLE